MERAIEGHACKLRINCFANCVRKLLSAIHLHLRTELSLLNNFLQLLIATLIAYEI